VEAVTIKVRVPHTIVVRIVLVVLVVLMAWQLAGIKMI
jgi:hypothetical protein